MDNPTDKIIEAACRCIAQWLILFGVAVGMAAGVLVVVLG